MFSLIPKAEKIPIYLIAGKTYVVGRNEGDIVINDKSMSRKHAQISITFSKSQMSDPSTCPKVILKDMSKYGTSINTIPLKGGEQQLKKGDVITFGVQPGVDFDVQMSREVVMSSSLSSTERSRLGNILLSLGCHLVKVWCDESTLLVMDTITVTLKVICSLIKQVPIVTMDYVEELKKFYLGNADSKPDSSKFTPPLVEDKIEGEHIDFTPHSGRSTLFKGKTVFFLTKEKMDKFQLPVQLAGGTALLYSHKEHNSSSLSLPSSIVIHDNPATSNSIKAVYKCLKTARRRPIIDVEIGYAVLFNSLNEYCNPVRKCEMSLYKDSVESEAMSVNPFAFDTQIDSSRTEISSTDITMRSTVDDFTRSSLTDSIVAISTNRKRARDSITGDSPPIKESPSSKAPRIDVKQEPNSALATLSHSELNTSSASYLTGRCPTPKTVKKAVKPEILVAETQPQDVWTPRKRPSYENATLVPETLLDPVDLDDGGNQSSGDEFDMIQILPGSSRGVVKKEPVANVSMTTASSTQPPQQKDVSCSGVTPSFQSGTDFGSIGTNLPPEMQVCSLSKTDNHKKGEESNNEIVPPCAAVVTRVNLIVSRTSNPRIDTYVNSDYVGPNYKRFKKTSSSSDKRPVIHLEVYQPHTALMNETTSEGSNKKGNKSQSQSDIQNSKIDRLFEEMCRIPVNNRRR